MVKKLAILCAPVLFVLVVGWAVIPVQAHCSGDETHNAKHKNDPCPVVGGGGGLFVTRNVINAFVLSYVVDGFEATTEVWTDPHRLDRLREQVRMPGGKEKGSHHGREKKVYSDFQAAGSGRTVE